MKLKRHDLVADGEHILPIEDARETRIGYMYEAEPEDVIKVLAMDPTLPDGFTRSQWMWVRLENGDLMLATFPQDDGYLSLEGTFQ